MAILVVTEVVTNNFTTSTIIFVIADNLDLEKIEAEAFFFSCYTSLIWFCLCNEKKCVRNHSMHIVIIYVYQIFLLLVTKATRRREAQNDISPKDSRGPQGRGTTITKNIDIVYFLIKA